MKLPKSVNRLERPTRTGFKRLQLFAIGSLLGAIALFYGKPLFAEQPSGDSQQVLLNAVKQLGGLTTKRQTNSHTTNNHANSQQLALAQLTPVTKPLTDSGEKNPEPVRPRSISDSNCLVWSASKINRKAEPYDKHIDKYARKYNIDTDLVKAVITAESCFRIKALSTAGAQGLMQLIPDTAQRFGVNNSYDPAQNIRGGINYLRFLYDRYKGELKKILAAYNAGEGVVDRYKGIPPYRETRHYVKNVLKIYDRLSPNDPLRKSTKRVSAIYYPPKAGDKPGRHGWEYNKRLAPHLFKQ